jgi:hypothetical protein
MSVFFRTAAVVLIVLGLAGSAAPTFAQQCQFVAPPEWSSATSIRWFGACDRGIASGQGVLRSYLNAKPGPAFYGRMVNGAPEFGVVETDNGFEAGRLKGGEVQQTGNRQTLIDAFRVGAAAARGVSAKFRSENNPGSAKFYADKAGKLERQMD